jgi:hypothetical protein
MAADEQIHEDDEENGDEEGDDGVFHGGGRGVKGAEGEANRIPPRL